MVDLEYIQEWFLAAFLIIFPLLVITIIVLIPDIMGKKIAKKKVKRENLSKIDFSKEKDYYRDILVGYSPAEIRYIDDFIFDARREIVAVLLSLKLKKKIDIKNDGITVLDSDVNQLKPTEKFILNSIKNGKVIIIRLKKFKNLIKEEAITDELIERNKVPHINENITKIIKASIMLQVILLFTIDSMDYARTIIALLILTISCIALAFISSYNANYLSIKSTSYKRTEKGENLNKKIEGLKKYIIDYSLLTKREQDELTIWEEYLIYSVIFNLNSTTIIEDIYKFVNIIIK